MRNDFNFVKLRCLNKNEKVNHNSDYLCDFRDTCGLTLINDCNLNSISYSNLGAYGNYELPNGVKKTQSNQDLYILKF